MSQVPVATIAPDPIPPRLAKRGIDMGGSTRHYVLLFILLAVFGLLMVYPVLRMIAVAFVDRQTDPVTGATTSSFTLGWFQRAMSGISWPAPWVWLLPAIAIAARVLFLALNAERDKWTARRIVGLIGFVAIALLATAVIFAECAPGSLPAKIRTSLALALVVTIFCNLIAFPLAIISNRYSFRGKVILSAMVLVPMVLPAFVGAIGMRQILSKFGSLTMICQHLGIFEAHEGINWLQQGGFWALAALTALGLYPIAYLNLQAALANIDPAMLEAAENLGGRRIRNFFKITLPLAMPGIFAGSTIIFIWAFTDLGTPLLLDYKNVVSRAIWDDLSVAQSGNNSLPYAKTTIVLLISVIVYLVGKLTLGRQTFAMTSKAAVAATQVKLGIRGSFFAALPFAIVIFLAMLPHIGVILYSFTPTAQEGGVGWGNEGEFGWHRSVIPSRYTLDGYRAVFNNPENYQPILNSIQYALISTVIDVILGVAVAWLLVRTRIWGRTALDVMAMLPLAIPGLVMAYGYLACQSQIIDFFNWFGLNLPPDWFKFHPFIILVIAYTMRRMPYLVRSATAGLQQTSVSLEEAAANMGASPMRVIWKVTVPLISANLIAGALLTFSFAMLEVSDSLVLAPMSESFPITKRINQLGTDTAGSDTVRNACALGVLSMGLLAATILTAGSIMGKKLGAIFRA